MLCAVSLNGKQQALQPVIEGSSPITAHQLLLKEISAKQASLLNEMWHSRLPKIHWSNIVRNTHYVCYGIYYKEIPLGVAIWSSPVAQNRFKDGKKILELRRLALNVDCPKNSATRVISIMIKLIKKKFPDIIKLISYQDTEVHKGIIYKASNWKSAKETKFILWNNGMRKRNKEQATGNKVRWEYDLIEVSQ